MQAVSTFPVPIALIGGGNMARGLIGGLLAKGGDPAGITVAEPNESARELLERTFGVHVVAGNDAALAGARVVILAVKPQIMATVVRALAPTLQQHRPLVISVAAGIPTDRLRGWTGPGIAVVRAMPNRPALIGAGATGLYADAEVSARDRALAEALLAATGMCHWVRDEAELDIVTALSGSGPAYFFRLAEAMAAAAVAQGLDPAVARRLAAQTLAGAGQLVAVVHDPDLARMRAEVASKGGTTEAALARFAELGLDAMVAAAMEAAARRSRELAQQFGDQ